MISSYTFGIYPRSEELIEATRKNTENLPSLFQKETEEYITAQTNANLGFVSDPLLKWDDIYRPFSNLESVNLSSLNRIYEMNTFYRILSFDGPNFINGGDTVQSNLDSSLPKNKTVDAVHEYTLPTVWDISTASYVDSFNVQSENEQPSGLAFSNNGKKMFVVGLDGTDDYVYEYTLGTDWDVSTASYVDAFGIASQDANPQDIWFDYAGETMFIVGDQGNDVNVYTLSTAWDISTASFTE